MRDVMGELRPQALDDHVCAALRLLAAAFGKRTASAPSSGRRPRARRRRLRPAALPHRRSAQQCRQAFQGAQRRHPLRRRGLRLVLELRTTASASRRRRWRGPDRLGLLTMRERAAAAGGCARFFPSPACVLVG